MDVEMGYVDPGAFGLISQIGYAVLFSIVSGTVFFKPIRFVFNKLFRRLGDSVNAEDKQMEYDALESSVTESRTEEPD